MSVSSGKEDEDDTDAFPLPPEPIQPPIFIEHLKPQEVRQGSTLKLSCRLSELPSSELKWFKDNVPLEMDSRKTITTNNDYCTLMISGVKPQDEGEYKLVATNNNGQCECSASVLVNESIKAPRFITSLLPLTIKEGEDAQLVVKVTGEPEVEWYRNESLITDDERFVIADALDGDDKYSLVIESCKPSDTGLYRCIARNAVGEAKCSAPMNVLQKPRVQKDVAKQKNVEQLKIEPGENN